MLDIPHDTDTERALVGCALISPGEVLTVDFDPDAFYHEAHRTIWKVMLRLMDQGQPVDFLTVCDGLGNLLDRVGGPGYISRLTEEVPTSLNFEAYARIVAEKAERRALIDAATTIAKLGYDEDIPIDTVVAQSEQAILSVGKRMKSDAITADEVVSSMVDNILAPQKRPADRVMTGLAAIDSSTLGIEDGRLWVTAAVPGTGKTALAINIVRGVLVGEQPAGVLYLHPEQPEKEIAHLLISCGTESIRPVRIKLLGIPKSERTKLVRSMAMGKKSRILLGDMAVNDLVADITDDELRQIRIAQALRWPMYMHDPSGSDIFGIRRVIRSTRARLDSEVGPQAFLLVVLDGLHLTQGAGEGNRASELTTISRGLKSAAQTDVTPGAVIASHQLNYAFYSGDQTRAENRNYSLRNFRDSGSIGNDCDIAVFIDRPSVFIKDSGIVPPGFRVSMDWDPATIVYKKNRQTSSLFSSRVEMHVGTMRVRDAD